MSNDVKVKIVESAQPQAAEAPKDITVTDARGRVIGIGKPPFHAQFDLVEAIGQSAENKTYMGMVSLLPWVKSIDGDPVLVPTTKLQVRALLQRLDEDGYTAVAEGVAEHFLGGADGELAEVAVKNG